MRLVWKPSLVLLWILTLGFGPGCSSSEPPAAQEPIQPSADSPAENPGAPTGTDTSPTDAATTGPSSDGTTAAPEGDQAGGTAAPNDGTTHGELTDEGAPQAEPPVPPSDGKEPAIVTSPADAFQEGALDTPAPTATKAKGKGKVKGKGRSGDGKVSKGRPHIVTAQVLNVRSGPSRKAKVVRQLEKGAKVRVLEVRGPFARIGEGEWVRTRHIAKATAKKQGGKTQGKGKKGAKAAR